MPVWVGVWRTVGDIGSGLFTSKSGRMDTMPQHNPREVRRRVRRAAAADLPAGAGEWGPPPGCCVFVAGEVCRSIVLHLLVKKSSPPTGCPCWCQRDASRLRAERAVERVLKLFRSPYYRWLSSPMPEAEVAGGTSGW